MITDSISRFDVTSNITGQKVAMSFDENSLVHIMSVLTDLYSDPMTAIIREYSTNALDAHIAAGVDLPIEVYTPSDFSQFIRIKDYGIGLSLTDIEEIYSKYGASTKRETNDMVGMLGLGCKSALTYTNQFTLVSVKNGIKIQTLISRDENGSGSITIVNESLTDEPNGTEVVVPTKQQDSSNFANRCEYFFSFWKPGNVLVNGQQPKQFAATKITDNIYMHDEQSKHIIVMGNVPYSVESSAIVTNLSYSRSLIAFVEIGDVNFTPSRESLQMTKKTNDKLAEIGVEFADNQQKAYQNELNVAANWVEAIKIRNKWESFFNYSSRPQGKFRGQEIPYHVALDAIEINARGRGYSTCTAVNVNFKDCLIVKNYDVKYSATHRKKLTQYLDNNPKFNSSFKQAYFVNTLPNSPFIPQDQVIDWKDVRGIKLERVTSSGAKIRESAGSYDAWLGGYWSEIPADDVDTSKPIYYIKTENVYNTSYFYKLISETSSDPVLLIKMPNNRLEKFVRRYPSAKNIVHEATTIANNWFDSIDKKDFEAYCLALAPGRVIDFFRKTDPNRLDDPGLKEYAMLASRDTKYIQEGVQKYRHFLLPFQTNNLYPGIETLNKYDLVDWSYLKVNNLEHMYIYLNAVYAKENS